MNTPAWETLATQLTELLNRDLGNHKIYISGKPFRLPKHGACATLRIYDKKSYKGTTATVVLVAEDDLPDPTFALGALRSRLNAIAKHRKTAQQAAEGDLAILLGTEQIDPDDVDFSPTADDIARREHALTSSMARFDAVAEHFFAVYALRLPRHVAVFDAAINALNGLESNGLEFLGRYPSGIMAYFADGGLNVQTRDGLDERLESRFRCDPPEMVTIMHGDSDGLHYGLWYDDPAELPSGIASNYARDSAETSMRRLTAIDTLHAEIIERLPYEQDNLALLALLSALTWYREGPQARALAEDGPIRYKDADRAYILGTCCPVMPEGSGVDPRSQKEIYGASTEYANNSQTAQAWIATARAELAAGRPTMAMVIGHELHWMDDSADRDIALELLTGAYAATGRDALAEIARVHYAHRDLRYVSILR